MTDRALLVFDTPALDVRPREKARSLLRGIDVSQVDVMAFTPRRPDQLLEWLADLRGAEADDVHPHPHLEGVFETVREEMASLVPRLRDRLVDVARDAVGPEWAQRLDERWWDTTIALKNTPGDTRWWVPFRLAAVEDRLEHGYDACLYVAPRRLAEPLEGLVADHVEQVHGVVTDETDRGLTGGLARRAYHGARTARIVRRARAFDPSSPGRRRGGVLAYTFFPRSWRRADGTPVGDRYYGETLSHLGKESGQDLSLGLLLKEDPSSPSEYQEKLAAIRDLPDGQQAAPLEAHANLRDVAGAYGRLSDVVNLSRTRSAEAYGDVFRWRGLDLTATFDPMLWESVVHRWPYQEVLRTCARRLADEIQPETVLHYLFEFHWGRAIVDGTRASSADPTIVGMQHGPITPAKLLYAGEPEELASNRDDGRGLPEPDVYALDGPEPAQILRKRGVDEDRIETVGPARHDHLWERARSARKRERFADDSTQVLVAPSLHDIDRMARFAADVLAPFDDVDLILKLHPKASADDLERELGAGGEGTDVHVVQGEPIEDWFERSDVFVCSYTSAGLEAVAFGLPVILVAPRRNPRLDPFPPGSEVLVAHDPSDLRSHIESLRDDPDRRQDHTEALLADVERNFGRLDGEAARRMAALVGASGSGT